MKNLKKYFLLAGLVLIIIGFIYDFFFAPIPSQKASIPVIISQIQQHKIADVLKRVGLIVFILGIILNLIFYIRKGNSK